MTGKELRKLGRSQLLELLVAQAKEMESLKERLAEAEAQMEKRQIAIDEAGSIAEASLALSGIFEAAEEAVSQYMENIKDLSDRQQKVYVQREQENRKKADEILRLEEDTRKQCRRLEEDTRKRCENMVSSAKKKEATSDVISLPLRQGGFRS